MPSVTESFNTADSTTLGPDQTWVESDGDSQIVSNALRAVAANTTCLNYTTAQTATTHKKSVATVKTFTTPTSGVNRVYVASLISVGAHWVGARINVDSSGVCTVEGGFWLSGAWTNRGGPWTITKPTAPFTFEVWQNNDNATFPVYVNGTLVGNGSMTFSAVANAGVGVFAQNNVSEVEVDSWLSSESTATPTALSADYSWPADGIFYGGPFVSSTGEVFVVGNSITTGTTNSQLNVWRATDPTASFIHQGTGSGGSAFNGQGLACCQVGDSIYITTLLSGNDLGIIYNMTTHAFGSGASIGSITGTPVNKAGSIARRSNGDVVILYNTSGVVSMSKTYGRIAARRIVSFPATAGAETQIGIAPAATTLQSESVDAAVLGASDRVHLFWTTTNVTAATGDNQQQRTVKSTENLDGTSPAGVAGVIGSGSLGPSNVSPSDTHRTMIQPSCNASGTLFVEQASNGTSPVGMFGNTVASADVLSSWTGDTNFTTISPSVSAFGNAFGATTFDYRAGGALWDGTSRYTTWIDATTLRPYYNGTSTTTWPAPTALPSSGTSTQISSNVFQRGSQVVLATVYDTSTGAWQYNEVVLRTVTPTSTYNQSAFRFRRDDGGEVEASPMAAQSTNVTQQVGGFFNFRLRMEVEETNSLGDTNSFTIQYRKNGGTWAAVTTSGTDIRLVTAAGVADGAATTDQLTGSAKSFVAGSFDTNGTVTAVTLTNQSSEFEYSMQAVASGIANNDAFDFRLVVGGTTVLGTYTATPTLTATVPAAGSSTVQASTTKFVCGAECGIAVAGTAVAGTTMHWSTLFGTPTVVTSGPATMRSPRCFRMNTAATFGDLRHTFATAISSGGTAVGRYYIYFTTLPNTSTGLFVFQGGTSATFWGAYFNSTDNKIYAGRVTGTYGATGVAVTTGQWYRIDVKAVFAATHTADVSVDGVACGQVTNAVAAETCTTVDVGNNIQVTTDLYIDDIIVSGTATDYPIGASTVVGLYPNGDRTNTAANPTNGNQGHFYSATTDFAKGATGTTAVAAQNVEATSWQSLQNPLSTTIGARVANTGGTTSEFMVWTHTPLPAGALSINGVMMVATAHSAAATANNFGGLMLSQASATFFSTGLIAGAYSITTIAIPVAAITFPATTGSWTPSALDGTKNFFQWGGSSDIAPVPYLDGVCLEVDYTPTPPKALTKPERSSDPAAIRRASFY